MARPHPLGGAAARSEIAKIHYHWSHRAPARLARPRDGLGVSTRNISVWRVRTPLLARAHGHASARWSWRVRALTLGALGPTTGRSAHPRSSDRASARAHYGTFLGPHLTARSHPCHGAPARRPLHL
ncbi:hypothetical protein PIB30_036330 [Stylosanthes scabra]|uniref:Uncharacterized protein n=1 Tax=Stylosanthes scabra TaxID=79078 RepID=A0ABU6VC68_9FABA|nr:hypothetical protein [Stylosanthes scabra]